MSELQPILVELSGSEKFTRLLAGIPSTAGMKSGYVTLKPGESIGEHSTDAREEAIIILEGQAEVYCSGKINFTIQNPSLLYIPPHTIHDIKNIGTKQLRYAYVVVPVKIQ